MKRMSPELRSLFDSPGVLPLDEELPHIRDVGKEGQVAQGVWLNSLMARMCHFYEYSDHFKTNPTIREFVGHEEYIGPNSPSTMQRFVRRVAYAAGVEVKKGIGLQDCTPRMFTPKGVEFVGLVWDLYPLSLKIIDRDIVSNAT